jgi:hypothetical protein
MDNYKLVTISIFFFVILKHKKDAKKKFIKKMLGKLLRFGCIHENKIFFVF